MEARAELREDRRVLGELGHALAGGGKRAGGIVTGGAAALGKEQPAFAETGAEAQVRRARHRG